MAYVGSSDGVHAVNLPAGTHAWSFGMQAPVGDTPTWRDGYLYVPCLDGHLYKIDATTGAFAWAYDAGAGIACSPAVWGDGRAFFGDRAGYAHRLNPDGTLAWRTKLDGMIMSPASIDSSGGAGFLVDVAGTVYRVDLASGAVTHRNASIASAIVKHAPVTVDSAHNRLLLVTGVNLRNGAPGNASPGASCSQGALPDGAYYGAVSVQPGAAPFPTGNITLLDVTQDGVEGGLCPVSFAQACPEHRTMWLLNAADCSLWTSPQLGGQTIPERHQGTHNGRSLAAISNGRVFSWNLTKAQPWIAQACLWQWGNAEQPKKAWIVDRAWTHAADESVAVSIGGNTVYCAKTYWRTVESRKIDASNTPVHVWLQESGTMAMWQTAFADILSWRYGALPGGNIPDSYLNGEMASYDGADGEANNGASPSPLVPVGGNLVLQSAWNCLCIWAPHGVAPAQPTATIARAIPTITPKRTPDLLTRLERAAGDLMDLVGDDKIAAPVYIAGGINGHELFNLPTFNMPEGDPGLTITALCLAWDKITDVALKAKIKAYALKLWNDLRIGGGWGGVAIMPWHADDFERRDPTRIPDVARVEDYTTYPFQDYGPWYWSGPKTQAAALVYERWPESVDLNAVYTSMGAGSLWNSQIAGFETFARQWREYGKFYMLNGWITGVSAYKAIMVAAGDTARAEWAQELLNIMRNDWLTLFTPQSQFPIYSTLFQPPWNGDVNWLGQRTYNAVRSWIFMSRAVADMLRNGPVLQEAREAIEYHRALSPVGFAPHIGYAGECNVTNLQGTWLTIADALLGSKTQDQLGLLIDEPAYVGDSLHLMALAYALDREAEMIEVRDIDVPSLVGRYALLEITFQLDTVATNLQMPFDAAPPPGVAPGEGVTADAIFTSPTGVSHRVPAFYCQEYDRESRDGQDWIYPTGRGSWVVRFSPDEFDEWAVKIVAVDASGTAESPTFLFTVEPSLRRGAVRVSAQDPRYFEYENGDLFKGLGHNLEYEIGRRLWDNPVTYGGPMFAEMATNRIDFARHWLSEWGVFGFESPWRQTDYSGTAGLLPIELANTLPAREVAFRLATTRGYGSTRFMFIGWLGKSPACLPETTYQVSFPYRLPQALVANDPSKPHGLIVKSNPGWLEPEQIVDGANGTPWGVHANTTTDGWQVYTATYRTGVGENFLPWVFIVLENCAPDGSPLYLDEIQIREMRSDGTLGPDILHKGRAGMHSYFSQKRSFEFDRALEQAEAHGVAIKLVLLEKNDDLLNRIGADGALGEWGDNNAHFYASHNTRVRWLQQAWFRYCQARWGYSAAIHSWELCNEGDPGSAAHYELAQAMARQMNEATNSHPSTTSFWHSFPTEFWTGARYADVGYSDLHRYVYAADPEWGDTARAHIAHASALPYVLMPVVRGETALVESDTGVPSPLVAQDTGGLWLKHWLWSQLYHKPLYELFWYSGRITGSPDLRGHYLALARFLDGLPLANGNYRDAQATGDGLLVVGQKDTARGYAHLWIRADGAVPCTWRNAALGGVVTPITADVVIPGMAAHQRYIVAAISTDNGETVLEKRIIAADRNGALVLRSSTFGTLRGLRGDVAFKVQNHAPTFFRSM